MSHDCAHAQQQVGRAVHIRNRPFITVKAREMASPEYSAIQKSFVKLKEVVTRGQIPSALFAGDCITQDVMRMSTNDAISQDKRANDIMDDVLNTVRISSAKFEDFCDALTEELIAKDLVEKLRATLQELRGRPEYLGKEDYQKLRIDLEAYSAALTSASDKSIELSAVNIMKDRVRRYIIKAFDTHVELSEIENNLKSLRDQVVLPTILWPWVQQEIAVVKERASKDANTMPLIPAVMKPPSPESPLFCKDTLYHASLCCAAIGNKHQANNHTYFQSKNPKHNFTEVSFSQSTDSITPYLVAMQDDILYVAFQGLPSINRWVKMKATSFDEGLRQQCNDIPLRFFIDQLNQSKKIVFTGFSFGGMLACCVCVRLWQSITKQEVLLQRAICITFGQPLLQIKMVKEEVRICPQFEKSIHSVFSVDDYVPLMMRCVDFLLPQPSQIKGPGTSSDVEHRVHGDYWGQQGDLFSNQFIRNFLTNLATLQDYLPQVSSSAHSVAAKKSQQDAKRRACNAVANLKKALQGIAAYNEQIEGILYGNCYVISKDLEEGAKWQQQPKHLAAIELSQRTKLLNVDEHLFESHNMKEYVSLINRSHLEKSPDKYVVPGAEEVTRSVTELAVLKPNVTGLDIHEYPNEHVLVLKGQNLWFTYKICFDEKGEKHEICTPSESTTKTMVEFRINHVHKVHSTLCSGRKVKITHFTHFAKPMNRMLDIKKESHVFSVRQTQLAMHTPTQVIQLAYLCALLEQRSQPSESTSKRFRAVASFLEEVVKVVPLESVFDAIAYEEHDVALECAKALMQRNPTLQISQQMIIGAGIAATRASSGYRGDAIDEFLLPLMFAHSMLSQFFLEFQPQPVHDEFNPHQIEWESQQECTSGRDGSRPKPASLPTQPQSSKKKPKGLSYSEVASNKGGPEMEKGSSMEVVSPKKPQPLKMLTPPFIPVPIPIVVDESHQPKPFPLPLVNYLNRCVTTLLEKLKEEHIIASAVGKTNIEDVYPVTGTRRNPYFKSPLQVLRQAMQDIEKYTEETHRTSASRTESSNRRMLNIIHRIYNHDVAVCASLLGAFMEQQIRIPLINSAKETAEELSHAAPVAVGVWALFSQNLRSLQDMLSTSNHSALVVEIKEYIEGISQQLPDHESKMYAGKLQFLLQGVKETVTASSQYISYSLEHQLYRNIKIDKTLSLKQLIHQWDKLFKNDALSLIGESHRSLVARWLKWTILIHDLREALAQYTCIGVTGLVNSGKSLLVKKLFKIMKVKVGTRAIKRTTVPLLYNLEESIEGLDVIDFPGVDDSDSTIPEMAELLVSIAQIVVFVVDYRKALSDPVKNWLKSLTKPNVPILVCLTHADVLYLECKDDHCESSIESELTLIQKHLKLEDHPTTEVAFYSFKHPCDVSPSDLNRLGIRSLTDVGHWLVETLRSKFNQDELADNLKKFITTE